MHKLTTYIVIILAVSISQKVKSQVLRDTFMIQYTGTILDEFLQPMPFANVYVVNRGVGVISDNEGKFSFIAYANDTIEFSSMGFKTKEFVIPDSLEEGIFVQDLLMRSDTFYIPEIEVYPWKDYEDFKEKFAELKLPEGDMQRAARNIAIMKAHIKISMEPSLVGNFNQIMQEQYQQTMNRGLTPTYQIFNVFAWADFFQALQNGEFKRKD